VRALTVIAEMGSGGAETVVADLAVHRLEQGDDVGVASGGGWRADELARVGVHTVDVPLRAPGPVSVLRTAGRLRREVASRPVGLVHAHNVRASVAARLGTRGTPMVTTVHGLADEDYPRAARLLRRSDLVVAVSQDVAGRLSTAGLPEQRLRLIENAVPAADDVDRAAARGELGLDPARPVVLCVARLAPPKRVDLLLDAWSGTAIDALLLVAGDGPDRSSLEHRAAGLDGRVRFLGDRRDVRRLLAAADVLVLPSDREGLPMTVLEAMAAGVPVVASAVGGLASFDPETIALVPPGSASALGDAVRRALADPGRSRRVAEVAREVVRRRYSSAGMRSAYENLYEELLGGRKS
jgi:glycosyltransferase involved in cell wall biosynthesis